MARERFEEAIRLFVETAGDRELAGLVSQLDKLSKGSDTAADQAGALVAELEKLASTSNNIKQFTTLKASITETGTALDKAKTRLAELGAEVDRTDKPTVRLQASLKRAATEVENLSKQQNRQQVELQRTAGSLRAAGVDTDNLAEAYDKLQGEFGGFSERAGTAADAMQKTARQGKAAATGVSALDKAAGAGKKSLGEIAAQLTIVSGAATAAIKGLMALSGAALFKGGIASATTLEQALSEVRAVAGATAEEMEALQQAAEAGGAATRFSTLEAAQGLGELARATGSAQSAIEALPATLNLAQAAGLGVADAAQFITTTLTQYGLAAEHASKVSDVLAQAANTTTADVQGLGNALSYAAPLANLLGLDVERTAAIIGTLADQGFRGERAGTALRNVFSEMLDPASAFAKALRDLGIESTDFVEVIEQLGAKGELGQEALLKLDAAARPAILSLVNSGSKALRQLDGDLRNAAGSADETARIMGDNLSGAAEQIRDSFDRTRRSLVEPLLEPLKDELVFLADQLEDFAASPEFEEIKQSLAGMFAEGAAAARDLVENIDFAELSTKIRGAIGEASATITEFKENLGTIIDTVAMVGNAFSLVFNSIQSAILLLAAAISKIVSLVAKLSDGFTAPQRKLFEFFGLIEEGEGSLAEFAGGMNAVADEFGGRFAENLDEAIDAAQRLAGAGEEAGKASAAALGAAGAAATAAGEAAVRLETVSVSAAAALEAQGAAAGGAADATAAAAGRMEVSSERLKKAFADMGLVSQVELRRAAESAKANFDLIREAVAAGEATAEDARRAFAKYAEAARAAVADSDESARVRVDAELSVHAAVLRVGDAFDAVGGRAVASGEQIAASASTATAALSSVSQSAATTSKALDQTGSSASSAGANASMAGDGLYDMKLALDGLPPSLIAAYAAMNRFAGTTFWSDNINRITNEFNAQSEALGRLTAKLDEQIEKSSSLDENLKKLKSTYDKLDEAQLRAAAQKLEQVERARDQARAEEQQAREAARRLREEATASAQQQGSGAAGSGNGPVQSAVVTRRIAVDLTAGDAAATLEIPEDQEAAAVAFMDVLARSRSISTRRRRPGS